METAVERLNAIISEVVDIKEQSMREFHYYFLGKPRGNREDVADYLLKNIRDMGFLPFISKTGEDIEIRIFYERPYKKEKYWINILLFAITLLTTMMAGALISGKNPLSISGMIKGIPFSFTLLIILGMHEFGHYITAKINRVRATLPYFIPAPNILGTFGAVIKIRSPITNKNALIYIGAAGPLVGTFFAIIASVVGLKMSTVAPLVKGQLYMGNSILFYFLSKWVVGNIPQGFDVFLNPIAFAGWIGLFVTALNLIPVSQLDGGHIAYAILGKWHKFLGYAIFVFLIALGFSSHYAQIWLFWALILLFIRFTHPPPLDTVSPITKPAYVVAAISLVVFIITFIPFPFKI